MTEPGSRRRPPFTPVRGKLVTLRALREAEFPLVAAAWEKGRSGPGRDQRFRERLRQRVRRSGRLSHGTLDLAIEADGRLIGDVQARHPLHALPPGVFEIGIEIYDPADQGKGYGSDAVRVITGWLFQHAGAGRVQAGTAVDNVSMQRVLEGLGFSFEGVMRGFMPVPSGRQDYALYGVTKPEWEGAIELSMPEPAVLTEAANGVSSGVAAGP